MNESIRSLFPVAKNYIYMNHAAVSPPPVTTVRAVEEQLKDPCALIAIGNVVREDWIVEKGGDEDTDRLGHSSLIEVDHRS